MVFYKTGDKIREAIFMYHELNSFRKVEKLLHIGKSTIQRWYNRFGIFTSTRKSSIKRTRKLKYPNLRNDITQLFRGTTLKYSSLTKIQSILQYNKLPSKYKEKTSHMFSEA